MKTENFLLDREWIGEYRKAHRFHVRLCFTLTTYIKNKSAAGSSICDNTDCLSDSEINELYRLFELIEGAALRLYRALRKLYDPTVASVDYDSNLLKTQHGKEYVRKDTELNFTNRTSAKTMLESIVTAAEEAEDILNSAVELLDDDLERVTAARICSRSFDRIGTVVDLLIDEEIRLLRTEKIPYRKFFLPEEIRELEQHPNKYRNLFTIRDEEFRPITKMTEDDLKEEFEY